MKKVAVIGAGVMGLAAAYHLLKAGHKVVVYESDSVAGGMAAHFDFEGLSIERFYHFICRSDQALIELTGELGLAGAINWRVTTMGFYYNGKLQPWGDPVSLIRFSGLGLMAKLRYGAHAFFSTKRNNWSNLDRQEAQQWIRKWTGEEAFRVCWQKLFELKFFEYSENISAAWIWTRIKRVGTSRKSMFKEQLGHIEGGSETLVQCLVSKIEELGGEVQLGTPVLRICIQNGSVEGISTDAGKKGFDEVISTVAIPYAVGMLSDLPEDILARYRALPNIGVVCVVHKLRRKVSNHFWVNINDPRFEIPGIVEFSNLRNTGEESVVYVPYYMPQTHPRFSWSDQQFIDETQQYLKTLNPELKDRDFLAVKIGRLRYAQPICGPGFLDSLPPISPGIDGLQVADTSYYYPEDRGISESVRLAKEMAAAVKP